jgi:maltooligosyltrehalose trehalohydrolase
LLALRHAEIIPRLDGARALDARAVGPKSVVARWRLGDGSMLTIGTDLGGEAESIPLPEGDLLFATMGDGEHQEQAGWLSRHSTTAFLDRGSGRR